MKKLRLVFWIALGAALTALAVTSGVCEKSQKSARGDLYEQIELFSDAVTYIRSEYVDEVESKDLIYGALRGMLGSLDAHSQFMDPETYKEIKIETKGEFGGIGIEITIKEGLLTVITPIDDTPGCKAGIKPGDIIVKIDGQSTKGISLLDAVKKMRGKPGTDIIITLLRENEGRIFDLTVTRGLIQIKSIKEARIIEDGIGYIRLSEFQENTPQDLREGLKKLKAEGMDSLILDLRNNPGGLLDVSASVADCFLDPGKVIVTTKGRGNEKEMVFKSQKEPDVKDYPLVVVVNQGSASASEIVAGAIQDNRRGIVLGTRTFGKGSVQTVIPLKDGSALRLTTAKYFTPNGRAIKEDGIEPDLKVEFEESVQEPKAKEEEVFEEVEKTEEKEKLYDNQLLRAMDLLKGIKAYRGLL